MVARVYQEKVAPRVLPLRPGRFVAEAYRRLYKRFGAQGWWPADNPFEVIVGAILTQNTSWKNVERALANLKRERLLTPERLHSIPLARLARLIRPSGYFNVKARRLSAFLEFFFKEYGGDLEKMGAVPTRRLREQLLGVWGIGPETADSILLYALDRPVFVVDAYTRRVLSRHGVARLDAGYEEIRRLFEDRLPGKSALFNEYHALIVRVGKELCRKTPQCDSCPLKPLLPRGIPVFS